jgi:hypothetical protein
MMGYGGQDRRERGRWGHVRTSFGNPSTDLALVQFPPTLITAKKRLELAAPSA